ncbi:MAG: hypothetical protein JWR69_792 [Pedosphaera sp.]|nr:hypothetical protein [Pedosphaera sp.]
MTPFYFPQPWACHRPHKLRIVTGLMGELFWKKWLSDMDSNHDKGLQRALCYHYTIGQTGVKLASPRPKRKGKF